MAKKKLNMQNPAMQFIEPKEELVAQEEIIPTGYKPNPMYIETKSRRVQLLMKPSIYEKVKQKAKADKNSINDTIHLVLEQYLND